MKNKKLLLSIIVGSIVIITAVVLFLLLSKKKITCTMTSDQKRNGYIIQYSYVIESKYGYVQSININEVITSKDSKILDKFENQFNKQYSYNKNTYHGYQYTVTNSDGKVESNITINYKEFDMKKFIKNNEAMKSYTKNNKLTLDGARKMYESTGATCK